MTIQKNKNKNQQVNQINKKAKQKNQDTEFLREKNPSL